MTTVWHEKRRAALAEIERLRARIAELEEELEILRERLAEEATRLTLSEWLLPIVFAAPPVAVAFWRGHHQRWTITVLVAISTLGPLLLLYATVRNEGSLDVYKGSPLCRLLVGPRCPRLDRRHRVVVHGREKGRHDDRPLLYVATAPLQLFLCSTRPSRRTSSHAFGPLAIPALNPWELGGNRYPRRIYRCRHFPGAARMTIFFAIAAAIIGALF